MRSRASVYLPHPGRERLTQRYRSCEGPERRRGRNGQHAAHRAEPVRCRGCTAAPAEADGACGRLRNGAIQVPPRHLQHAALEFVLQYCGIKQHRYPTLREPECARPWPALPCRRRNPSPRRRLIWRRRLRSLVTHAEPCLACCHTEALHRAGLGDLCATESHIAGRVRNSCKSLYTGQCSG